MSMFSNLDNSWQDFFALELEKNYVAKLEDFVSQEYRTKTIFPQQKDILNAFSFVAPKNVKVVILGQDPYHGKNQAHGLAFSVCSQCKIPPSLKNIYKELIDDEQCLQPANGDLSSWAKEGVLLLNTVFTVEESKPHSHKGRGWEILSDFVIQTLSQKYSNLIFILWGAPAQKKVSLIDTTKHLILKAPHPSPLSSYRGFFTSKPFSQSNEYLKLHGKSEIRWCLKVQETLL